MIEKHQVRLFSKSSICSRFLVSTGWLYLPQSLVQRRWAGCRGDSFLQRSRKGMWKKVDLPIVGMARRTVSRSQKGKEIEIGIMFMLNILLNNVAAFITIFHVSRSLIDPLRRTLHSFCRAYLVALPTSTSECSHRVWSRSGRGGCSDVIHDDIAQWHATWCNCTMVV